MLYTSRSLDSLRIPVSLTVAVIPPAVLFWCLWSLTRVDYPDLPILPTFKIKYERTLTDTTLQVKPLNELELPPPPVTQKVPRLVTPDHGNTPVPEMVPPYKSPGTDIGKHGLPMRMNSDPMIQIRVEPAYPPRAIAQGLEGWVKVQFTITASGLVKDAKVVESSASVFEKAAVNAILRWRYNPMVVDGVGMERTGVQTILRFKLEN